MPDASEPTDRYFKIAALRKLLTFDKGGKGSSFDLNTSASMNSKVQKATWVFSGLIFFALAGALYNISFTHGQRGSDVAMIGGALQNRRLAPGLALQKVYKHSAESAAPDSVLPPAANSLWIAFYASLGMLGGCVGIGIGMGITMSITMGFFRANPICQADLGHWRRVHPIIPEVIF